MEIGSLVGKQALVTGATGNLGSAIVRGLARAGADVIVTSRSLETLKQLCSQVELETGVRCTALACDLSVATEVTALGRSVAERYEAVDVLVLNAVPPLDDLTPGTVMTTPEDHWAYTQELIAMGPVRLLREISPLLTSHGSSVISLLSPTSETPTPGYSAYGVAKASLRTLTRYIAMELGPYGVRANGLSLGTIATHPTLEARMQQRAEQLGLLERCALRRIGKSEDVVPAVVFLASESAAYISGQVLSIDGGRF